MSRGALAGGRLSAGRGYLVVLAGLLLICLVCSPDSASACVSLSWQSDGLAVRVDPPVKNVGLRQSFTVQVVVDGAVDLGAFQFELLYDPAVVTVTDVVLGPLLGGTGRTAQSIGPNVDSGAGMVSFAAFSFGSQAGPAGTGTLAILTFAALSSGTTDLTLQGVVVTDTMAQVQSASVEGGRVVVAAPAPAGTPTATPRATPPPMPTPTGVTSVTPTAEPVPAATPTGVPATATTGEAATTPAGPSAVPSTATPAVTAVRTPTGPSAVTPAGATRVSSPSPGAVSSPMPPPTPRSRKGPADSWTAALSGVVCWLAAAGTALLLAGLIALVLMRRNRA